MVTPGQLMHRRFNLDSCEHFLGYGLNGLRSIAVAISFVSLPLGPGEPHALPLETGCCASKSRAVYQLEPSTGVAPLASPPVRCRHSDTRYTDGSIQIGRRSAAMGKEG